MAKLTLKKAEPYIYAGFGIAILLGAGWYYFEVYLPAQQAAQQEANYGALENAALANGSGSDTGTATSTVGGYIPSISGPSLSGFTLPSFSINAPPPAPTGITIPPPISIPVFSPSPSPTPAPVSVPRTPGFSAVVPGGGGSPIANPINEVTYG